MKTKIALLGYGTIGSGVYDLINNQKQYKELLITKILEKKEKFDSQLAVMFTDSIEDILYDKEISIVIEVMGTLEFSYNCIKKALINKKHVITANKEVVALYLDELLTLAKANNVYFLFEASVGGGMRVISSIVNVQRESKISGISGILNGTTNFILSKMQNENLSFQEALKISQDLGFCEKDYANDIEGYDMMRKILILSRLAYQTKINLEDIKHFGLSNINNEYLNYLKEKQQVLKYLCYSRIKDNNLTIKVEPCIFSIDNVMAHVNNENNIIRLETWPNDTLYYIGKGAGKYPTSTAIISDINKIIADRAFEILPIINNYQIVDHDSYGYLIQKNKIIFKSKNKEDLDNADFYALINDEVVYEKI